MPNREESWNLLCEYTQSESLRKHALAVEACVRAYARKLNVDVELWGVAALLHDFDYERFPEVGEHAIKGAEILRERGWPEEIWYGVLSHADLKKYRRHVAVLALILGAVLTTPEVVMRPIELLTWFANHKDDRPFLFWLIPSGPPGFVV